MSGQSSQRQACILDHDQGPRVIAVRIGPSPVHHGTGRAIDEGLVDEIVAIETRATQGYEQLTPFNVTAVRAHANETPGCVDMCAEHIRSLLQTHHRSSPGGGFQLSKAARACSMSQNGRRCPSTS